MENDKMKMVMMNEELFIKYADAARSKVIEKMKDICDENGKKKWIRLQNYRKW